MPRRTKASQAIAAMTRESTQHQLDLLSILGVIEGLSNRQVRTYLERNLEIIPIADRIAILRIVADAPPMYRDLFFAFAHLIDIADIESTRIDENGNVVSAAFFNSNDATVHFSLYHDRNGDRGPFFIFFHEIGHMIDWALAGTDNMYLFNRTDNGFRQQLFDDLYIDVRNRVTGVADGMNMGHIPEADRDFYRLTAVNNIMSGQPIALPPPEDPGRFDAFAALTMKERFQSLLETNTNNVLRGSGNPERTRHNMVNPSNIFGGITNAAVSGHWSHPAGSYWFNEDGIPTFNQNTEMFAHHIAASMTSNPIMLQNELYFFPIAMGTAEDPGVFMRMMDEAFSIAGLNREGDAE
jgi:hypothetical protein